MKRSVSAIITRAEDDAVYIAQRSFHKKVAAGLWETIGGDVHEGERLLDALKREIKEELKVTIEKAKAFKKYEISGCTYHVYVVKLNGEPDPDPKEIHTGGWYTQNDIEDKKFTLNCLQRLQHYWRTLV